MSNDLVLHKQFTTNKNDVTISTCDGRSILEFIEFLQIPESSFNCLKVYIGGVFIEQSMYKFVRPKPNSKVKLLLIPAEGDETFFMIAMIAIAVAAPYAAPAMGVTNAWGAAAITAGITIAGSLLVNALFPPPITKELSSDYEGSSALTIAGSRNSFNYDKPIPRIYAALLKFYPPHAAQPYTISEGGAQYLYMLFDFGYGPIVLDQLKFGDTAVIDYDEVQYNIIETVKSVSDLTWFTGDIDSENVNATLIDGDPATVRVTSTEFKYAQFDLFFGSGLYGLDSNNDPIVEEITFSVTVRDDTDALIPDANISITDVTAFTSIFTLTKITTTDFTIGSNSQDGFSLTLDLRVAIGIVPDFIKIELTRVSTTTNGIQTIDACGYTTLRTYRLGTSIKPFRLIDRISHTNVSHTMVEMRIKATDQLNGVIDNFSAMSSSKLRMWNGSAFTVPIITDNPAWIYADILTGTMNQRPKDDSKINWNELLRWADFCDVLAEGEGGVSTKSHTCNFVLDYSTTIHKLLIDITAVGRASPDIYDDMYSVIFEEQKAQKIQIFSNMNTMDFSSSRIYTEIPDAVRISFRDPDSDWQMREHVVYNDGFDINNSELFEDISAPMLTSSNEAYRNGRYWIKQAALRKETITFKTDLEWLECKRGSFVGLQMDIIKAGGSVARVKSVVGDVVIVDSDPTLNGNEVSWFELRKIDGTIISGPVAYYHVSSPYEIDLGIIGANIGDIIVLNSSAEESYDLLIKQIEVNDDKTAIITCIEYAPALFDLASEPVPYYNPSISNILDIINSPDQLEYLYIVETLQLVSDNHYVTLTLNFMPALGIIPLSYRVYKQDIETNEWIFQGSTTDLSYIWGDSILVTDTAIIGVQHCFSVVGVGINNSFINPALGRQDCIVPQGDTTIPPTPDYFVVEDTAENFRRFWWGYDQTTPPDDLKGYLIKYTQSSLADWSSATALHDGLLISPPFEIRALPTGTQIVMLRACDISGNLCAESANILFNMGDRAVENVLFTHAFNPAWTGDLVSGSGLIDIGVLTVDTNTSGIMWNTDTTVLMWADDATLMWTSPNDSFKWIESLTVPVGGITKINWIGTGEVRILYALGSWPASFKQIENLVSFPEDQLDVSWVSTATVTLTTEFGPDNSNRVFNINDSSLVSSEFIAVNEGLTVKNIPLWGSCFIKKDITSRAVRFPLLRVQYDDGVLNPYADISLDTSTGEFIAVAELGATVHDSGVIDSGDYWFIYVSAVTTSVDQASMLLTFFPAVGSDINWGHSLSAIGSVDSFGFFAYNRNEFLEYVPLSSLVYTGAGQGIIPYTSPINLDAGDYVVIVDSPIAIDVNTITEMTWITDVPDINEYFDDIVILATTPDFGNVIISLTKTFTVITNVSITLQAGGTADKVIIIDKTNPVQIEIRAETIAGLDASATVDIRVQGY